MSQLKQCYLLHDCALVMQVVYDGRAACLTDISVGDNGTYSAQAGYDLCTGMGVPNKSFLAAWLTMNNVQWSPNMHASTVL
jgi:hypothetical protein